MKAQAPDRGLAVLQKYEEFKAGAGAVGCASRLDVMLLSSESQEMGCPEAAAAVLRL